MKAITNDIRATVPFPKAGEIPVTQHLRDVLAAIPKSELESLFNYLRLDLHSRMSSLDDRGLTQLQGKENYLDELERFFSTLLK